MRTEGARRAPSPADLARVAICGKWRSVPASAPEVGEWHCGLWEPPASLSGYARGAAAGRARSQRGGGVGGGLPEEPGAPGTVPHLGPPGAQAAVGGGGRAAPAVVAAVGGGGGGYRGTAHEAHPRRRLALRNLLLWLWAEVRGGRATAPQRLVRVADARRRLHAPGLQRVWCCRALLAVHRALERLGLISFGACRQLRLTIRPPSVPIKTVIVVGAGIAGLAAARQLRRWGHRVVARGAARGGRRPHRGTRGPPRRPRRDDHRGHPRQPAARWRGRWARLHARPADVPLFDGTAPLDSEVDARAEAAFTKLMADAAAERGAPAAGKRGARRLQRRALGGGGGDRAPRRRARRRRRPRRRRRRGRRRRGRRRGCRRGRRRLGRRRRRGGRRQRGVKRAREEERGGGGGGGGGGGEGGGEGGQGGGCGGGGGGDGGGGGGRRRRPGSST